MAARSLLSPFLVALSIFSSFNLSSFPFASAKDAQNSTTAIYYEPPYIPGACYGDGEDVQRGIAQVNDALYDNKNGCGKYYHVNCTGPSCKNKYVDVLVVDHCVGNCKGATFVLTKEDFDYLTDTNTGKISITYEQYQGP